VQRQPVESTTVKSVGYDPETQTLEVELQTGGVYQYDAIEPEYYNETIQDGGLGAEQLLWDIYGEGGEHRTIAPGASTDGRQPVSSSMLRSVGYNVASETLEAEFNDGAVWRYYGVPEFIYLQLINSDSLGGFMRDFIIDQYPEGKIEGKRYR
jgi:KTSC domain